jgi:putative ATPase
MEAPLAERIRPQQLEDYISQTHLIGPEGSLTQQIAKGIIPSLIFWGPPGTQTNYCTRIATPLFILVPLTRE